MIPKQKKASNKRYTVIRPATHKGWLDERKNGIGASEAGIILGVNKYSTPYQLWLSKLGLIPPVEETWAMKQGHIFEPYIAQLFEEEIGYKVIKASKGDWLAVDNKRPYLRVSPDWTFWHGEVKNEKGKALLECKSSRNDYQPSCLGGDCLSWFVQCQYQMYVMGYDTAYLGFICVENGNHWFEEIAFDEKFTLGTLIPAIEEFWTKNILPAKKLLENGHKDEANEFAPMISEAEDVPLRYPKQEDGKTLEADDDFLNGLSGYLLLKESKKNIEAKMKEFEDETRLRMTDAESIVDKDGKPYVTYKKNKDSMTFDGKRFAADNKELYDKYLVTKTGARVLKFK